VSLWVWFAVAGAGALGSVLRYLADTAVSARRFSVFPFGTLTVNLSGSLVFGALTGLALYHAFPDTAKVVLGSGVCGAYTTFSTFCLETVVLAREGERLHAVRNVAANLVGCCVAAAIGLALAAL
jgi:CrcB protein